MLGGSCSGRVLPSLLLPKNFAWGKIFWGPLQTRHPPMIIPDSSSSHGNSLGGSCRRMLPPPCSRSCVRRGTPKRRHPPIINSDSSPTHNKQSTVIIKLTLKSYYPWSIRKLSTLGHKAINLGLHNYQP